MNFDISICAASMGLWVASTNWTTDSLGRSPGEMRIIDPPCSCSMSTVDGNTVCTMTSGMRSGQSSSGTSASWSKPMIGRQKRLWRP